MTEKNVQGSNQSQWNSWIIFKFRFFVFEFKSKVHGWGKILKILSKTSGTHEKFLQISIFNFQIFFTKVFDSETSERFLQDCGAHENIQIYIFHFQNCFLIQPTLKAFKIIKFNKCQLLFQNFWNSIINTHSLAYLLKRVRSISNYQIDK